MFLVVFERNSGMEVVTDKTSFKYMCFTRMKVKEDPNMTCLS